MRPDEHIPQVYVSVSDGIARTTSAGDVEIIRIDWDTLDENADTGDYEEALDNAIAIRNPVTRRDAIRKVSRMWDRHEAGR
jgi:hypothetical protein